MRARNKNGNVPINECNESCPPRGVTCGRQTEVEYRNNEGKTSRKQRKWEQKEYNEAEPKGRAKGREG